MTNYEKYLGSPYKAAEIIYRLKYPRIGQNYLPSDFEKAWLDWYGSKTENLSGDEYCLLDLWVEWLQEECE